MDSGNFTDSPCLDCGVYNSLHWNIEDHQYISSVQHVVLQVKKPEEESKDA